MRIATTTAIAAVLATGCGSTTYQIPQGELARLATLPPESRGEHVRVVEQLHDTYAGDEVPVGPGAQLVIFPEPGVYGPRRREYAGRISGGNVNLPSGSGGGGGAHGATAHGGGHGGGGGGFHMGGGGDGKGEAIMLLVAAGVILFVAAAVEGARYDGYAQLHPMQAVHLFGKDGTTSVMPLAWIDPETAAWADKAYVHDDEAPWHPLGRAPLDRQGLTYAVLGGVGAFKSADGSKGLGPDWAIQFGYFPTQCLGIVSSLFLGWRNETANGGLFETRYTLEVQDYVGHAGPVHLGFYAGAGGASRFEGAANNPGGGNDTSLDLLGGAQLQLDINTRLAITARLGETYAHSTATSDAMIGLSVY